LLTAGIVLSAAIALAAAGELAYFLLRSPRMALLHPSQIAVFGNQCIASESIYSIFAQDRGRSVLLIPLDKRRSQIEAMPWVASATVRRALPNQLVVEVIERVPVAWLREGTELLLVDVNGVILDRPSTGKFHFPVVTGLKPQIPEEERAHRMKLFMDFVAQIESVHPGATDDVSEVDLSQAGDVRASFEHLPGDVAPAPAVSSSPRVSPDATTTTDSRTTDVASALGGPISPSASAPAPTGNGSLVVDFGDRDFGGKYSALVANIAQWRAAAGRVYAVDLRFGRQAVINPAGLPAVQTNAPQESAGSISSAPADKAAPPTVANAGAARR
jgi:hypothetical protein